MILATPLFLALSAVPGPEFELMSLFDFRDEDPSSAWRPIHDGVMGGVSSGRSTPVEDAVRFAGEVSLDNNGGFASFRMGSSVPDLSDFDGLRLRVRGDGQVYKLSLRTDGAWDGVSWQTPFLASADGWTTVDLAFEDLVPTWRGRLVREAEPFDPSSIRQIGILIADKQAGPFVLELASIEAWRGSDAGEGSRAAHVARSAELVAALESGAAASGLSEAMRWNERALVVAAPGELDASASKQIGHLLARGDDLAARELRVVNLMGSRGGRLAGRTLSAEQVRELREGWELPANEWLVALVGKDGDVKMRWSARVEPDQVFELIDAMPMGQRELEERRTE